MNTKHLRHFGLSLLTGLVLAACGANNKPSETKPTETKPTETTVALTPATKLMGELNVYNWAEYIPEAMQAEFEKSTGVKVNYDTFDSDETLNAKVIAGSTGYDIVVPGLAYAEAQIKQGKYLKLDKTKIPNLKNLDPELMAQIAKMDPNNDHLVPWAWGYTGVGINEEKVKKALGNMPLPENPFDLVLNPQYTNKLKSCGIFMLDSPSEILPVALQYIGKPADSSNIADFTEAYEKALKPVRADIRKFGDSGVVNDLANGSICVMLGWSGDVKMASNRAKNDGIHMLLGKKGGIVFFDTMAIPADAKNVDNAYAWINNYLDAKVGAAMTNELGYATVNRASLEFVKPELAKNQYIFLSADTIKGMEVRRLPASDEAKKAMTTVFTKFKSSK